MGRNGYNRGMRCRGSNAGFTLVELVISVAIVGLLVALSVPALQRMVAKSRQAEARTNLLAIHSLEHSFFNEHQRYGSIHEIGFRPLGVTRYGYCVGDINDPEASCVAPANDVGMGAGSGGTGPNQPPIQPGGGEDPPGNSSSPPSCGKFCEDVSNGLARRTHALPEGVRLARVSPGGGAGTGAGLLVAAPAADPGMGNPHFGPSSYEADAYGKISHAPPPNHWDRWFIDQTGQMVNYGVGY